MNGESSLTGLALSNVAVVCDLSLRIRDGSNLRNLAHPATFLEKGSKSFKYHAKYLAFCLIVISFGSPPSISFWRYFGSPLLLLPSPSLGFYPPLALVPLPWYSYDGIRISFGLVMISFCSPPISFGRLLISFDIVNISFGLPSKISLHPRRCSSEENLGSNH
jgi:hypothetical protein